ncbi:hypothetical protein [Pseudomonas massiliensis]|nr:hypothetical protein [Pseudomonas massiliensis]
MSHERKALLAGSGQWISWSTAMGEYEEALLEQAAESQDVPDIEDDAEEL